MENLAEYLSDGVEAIVKQALKASFRNPRESAFLLKYMSAQQKAAKKRLQAEADGIHIPPFLIASISAECNLFCSGCYARAQNSISKAVCGRQLSDREWERIFLEAEELGVSFILLAGGEPLMRRNVLEAAGKYPDIVFPVFTNGTMLLDDVVALFNKNRNLVPILSIEGDKAQTDARRGDGVFDILISAMADLKEKGILFGVSITVTKENLDSITDPGYIQALNSFGCKVILFVEYVPVSVEAGESAPDNDDRRKLMERQESLRTQFDDMLFIAFPGDEESFGGCLAAGRGFFHINPTGDAEPCPFSPFSDTSLKTHTLKAALQSPLFQKLNLGGYLAGEHQGGCVLYSREREIRELLQG